MPIARLNPLVAQRIAAGEVIERPSSVIRELIDNSLDAGSTSITVSVTEGGIEKMRVLDDGSGIAKGDLPLLGESHATSKIRDLDDLYHITSMGFRGEALYSIAAVSSITIASNGYELTIDNGKRGEILSSTTASGTLVIVKDLFGELPARRQFLKRAATEAAMVRTVLQEKALAYPNVAFKLIVDGSLRLNLPVTTAKDRVVDVLTISQRIVKEELIELLDDHGRFSLYAVASSAALWRSDRSHIKIFVNKRPVDEYALVQAVTYGYSNLLPGGSFPYCYLFITIDPSLVDFNIHPTKREVRLRNKAEIHHQVVQMISSQVRRPIPRLQEKKESPSPTLFEEKNDHLQTHSAVGERSFAYTPKEQIDPSWFAKAREALKEPAFETKRTDEEADIWTLRQSDESFTYLGQAFNLFLIAQKGDDLFLVDQHAAHERILYDQVRAKQPIQNLMIPIVFEVERSIDEYLMSNLDSYLNLGIKLRKVEDLAWELLGVPALYRTIEHEVIAFLQTMQGEPSEIEKGLYSVVACHAAIKAGDRIDSTAATELLKSVFALEEPICPHGRTFVIRLNKDDLMTSVGRT
ncbi:MAG: DNA mismatch repair endonuclease MutL [Spirochaetales bacterium]|nr:DNA mismatch repair endonuclease MutL [Spirochaetales bacterium]